MARYRQSPHQSQTLSGFTMMEIMIASAILFFAVTMSMSALIYSLRIAKAQRTTLRFVDQTNTFERLMKQYANAAQQYVTNNGNTLTIEPPTGAQSQMSYSNGDGSDTTLADNTMTWTPDTTVPQKNSIIMRGIYPMDASTPIFALENASASSVPGGKILHVRLRMGEHDTATVADNAYTGINYQTYVINSYFTPRNSVSSSGGSF